MILPDNFSDEMKRLSALSPEQQVAIWNSEYDQAEARLREQFSALSRVAIFGIVAQCLLDPESLRRCPPTLLEAIAAVAGLNINRMTLSQELDQKP